MKEISGFVKLYVHSVLIVLVFACFSLTVLYTTIFACQSIGFMGEVTFHKWILISHAVVVICFPIIIAWVYFKSSSSKKGNLNRFNREHVRYFKVSFNKEVFLNVLKEFGCIDVVEVGSAISFKFPDVHLKSNIPGLVGEWMRSRQARIDIKESYVEVRISPIRKAELMDFSLSNYFHLDKLVERLGWESKEADREVS